MAMVVVMRPVQAMYNKNAFLILMFQVHRQTKINFGHFHFQLR
jgi:hypothetical protein